MNAHIFQGPEGNKGEKGEPVCAAIKKHKHDFIFIQLFVIFKGLVMLSWHITESQYFLSCFSVIN